MHLRIFMTDPIVLPILKNPDPLLRRISAPVDLDRLREDEFLQFIQNLKITMRVEDGVGIAAPQVGVAERVIIIDRDGRPTAYINPEITERSFKMIEGEEGCLSVNDVWGIVKRHRGITVTYITEQGERVTEKLHGFLAVVFQHEIDHLDGILFIDRATKTYPKR